MERIEKVTREVMANNTADVKSGFEYIIDILITHVVNYL